MSDRDRVRNKHGCLAPQGFSVQSHDGYPEVAIGRDEVGTYEAVLSVSSLERYMFAVVRTSATLKAWFAFKLAIPDLRETHYLEIKTPTWERVWHLIQQKGAGWMALAERQGLQRNQWELDEPRSILDLFMYTLVVLHCSIQANTNDKREGTRGYRWHDYYYEDQGKFFLLYRFLLYHTRLFLPGRANSIHPPLNLAKLQTWQQSYGCRIRQASESFMDDTLWDPLWILGHSLGDRAPRALPQPNANKIATFVLIGGPEPHIIRKDVKTIRRHMRPSLRGTLEFLLPVGRVNVKADASKKLIKSPEEFWSSIESSNDPVFWLQSETEDQGSPSSVITNQRRQRNYSNHAVLKLEQMVDKLNDQDHARSTQSRFNLIKENHPHSADLIQDLESYFAPLEQATTTRWQRLSTRKQTCEEVMKDHTQFYKLRHLVADLGDTQQIHAQQYFTLVNTNNPLASAAAENLIKLFQPDETEAEEVSKMKGIFDEVKRDTSESGEAAARN